MDNQIIEAIAYLKNAASAYVINSDGIYVPPKRTKGVQSYENFLSLAEEFEKNLYLQNLDDEGISELKKVVDGWGFKTFNLVEEGENAQVYESGGRILRIGGYPIANPPDNFEMHLVRPNCPLTLQPEIYFGVPGVRVENLSYLVMLEDKNHPPILHQIFNDLLSGTQFELEVEWKDLAVLPDGTPVYVDPGCIRFIDKGRPLREDFEVIAQRTKALQLPDPLNWILPDGRFKQTTFFPSMGRA